MDGHRPIAWSVGILLVAFSPAGHTAEAEEAADGPPETIELMGIVRDMRERNVEGGHPDFERRPDAGFGLYVGNVAPTLGSDGKPVFAGEGRKVKEPWTDAQGRPICYLLYDADLGDHEGDLDVQDSGGITSVESFSQWYRDEPGTNISAPLTITLHRQADGTYMF
ncbi:MAG: hypothetical protein ACYS0G_16800, partial [Planctomycetota bacterium]